MTNLSIFGTAAIEGNPLTEEKVGEIISESDRPAYQENPEIEIANLKKAYDFIKSLKNTEKPFNLEEDLIKEVHTLVTINAKYELNNPGRYRNHKVQVGDQRHGGMHTPPKCLEDVQKLMKEYVKWINSGELQETDTPIRAALAHYYLGLIHPFGDGNGRTARLIEALIMQNGGIRYVPVMLSNYYYRNIDDYFRAFSNSIRSKEHDVTPFIEFVLDGCIESSREIKDRITYFIRKFSLRDYYSNLKQNRHITQRQYDLLITLLDYDKAFALSDLFNLPRFGILYRTVSERTARRDLVRLKDMELLINDQGAAAKLNWRVLG
ncbi:MAG TPA: Fic family protein [Deltaproteobacteria bacterium]|nr:Fic family protein [Deltaproteobacteria bacterium]